MYIGVYRCILNFNYIMIIKYLPTYFDKNEKTHVSLLFMYI